MRSRVRSTRENRRFSCLEKVLEDFFHGQLVPGVFMGMASRYDIRMYVTVVDIRGVNVVVRVRGVAHDSVTAIGREPCRAPCRNHACTKSKA